ncbi:MAG: TlpA disulfide reductase family protein [Phycisphaerales bacterium]
MRQQPNPVVLVFLPLIGLPWPGGPALAQEQAERDAAVAQPPEGMLENDRGEDGLALLRAADEALRDVSAIAFTVTREGVGALATRDPHVVARAVAVRTSGASRAGLLDAASTPQWHVAVFGLSSTLDHASPRAPFAFTMNEQGVRVIDFGERTLVESGHEHASAVLMESDAHAALEWLAEWETLVGRPIVDQAPRVPPKLDGRIAIGDELTNAIYVDLAEFPNTYAFGAWWFLGVDDGLPRRSELVYYDVRNDDNVSVGDGVSRTTISDIQRLDSPADTADAIVRAASLIDGAGRFEPQDGPYSERIDPANPFALPTPPGYETKAFQPADLQRQAAAAAPPLNIPAPDFTLVDPQGDSHTLSQYQGGIVILDFWATWCGPCLMVMPHLQAVHEQFKGQNVTVMGINAWENGDPQALMKEEGFDYLLLLNGDAVAAEYGVTGIPTMVVIDQQGVIVERHVGADPQIREKLVETITRLQGEN